MPDAIKPKAWTWDDDGLLLRCPHCGAYIPAEQVERARCHYDGCSYIGDRGIVRYEEEGR